MTTCRICNDTTGADRCLGDGGPHCDRCISACIECADTIHDDQLIYAADAKRKGEL